MSPPATATASAIREARRSAGLTQFQVAQRADCSLAYVQMTERGYEPADPSKAKARTRILTALGLRNDERRPATSGAVTNSGRQPRHGEA